MLVNTKKVMVDMNIDMWIKKIISAAYTAGA